MQGRLIPFPSRTALPTLTGATSTQISVGRLREKFGRLLNQVGIPGAVTDSLIEDAVAQNRIEIQRGNLFTRISVNGRDYYFNRITGKFGGTGSGCL